jgi:hypothetical protein
MTIPVILIFGFSIVDFESMGLDVRPKLIAVFVLLKHMKWDALGSISI